jgi:hypothetical protein
MIQVIPKHDPGVGDIDGQGLGPAADGTDLPVS